MVQLSVPISRLDNQDSLVVDNVFDVLDICFERQHGLYRWVRGGVLVEGEMVG